MTEHWKVQDAGAADSRSLSQASLHEAAVELGRDHNLRAVTHDRRVSGLLHPISIVVLVHSNRVLGGRQGKARVRAAQLVAHQACLATVAHASYTLGVILPRLVCGWHSTQRCLIVDGHECALDTIFVVSLVYIISYIISIDFKGDAFPFNDRHFI